MHATREIIKSAMSMRGYRHRRTDHQFSINGAFVRNLQYVYSKETKTRDGLVIDLIYFGVDMRYEKLVIGFYRENVEVENGVYANTASSISLDQYSRETVDRELDKLIVPLKEHFNKRSN